MNDRLLRALKRETVDRPPVWFMRQAGRSLPRYRELRSKRGIQELIRDPRAAAEVTALPLEYYPVDAAVLFSDLSTPYEAAGFPFEIRESVGPVVAYPIRSAADLDRLTPFEPRDALDYVLEHIRIVAGRLDVPVIGFIGAPFTISSYLLGGPRKSQLDDLKTFIWREPAAWDRLAGFWADQLADYAVAQHEAGAAAIQLFDSWAGVLGPDEYREHVLPYNRRILDRLRAAGVPSIHFATGNPRLLPLMAEAGGDAISVDWRVPLDEAWSAIGDRAIQGNLDPVALLAGRPTAVRMAREILRLASGRPGHIFNLGHGILPGTDHEVVRAVVDAVHAYPEEC